MKYLHGGLFESLKDGWKSPMKNNSRKIAFDKKAALPMQEHFSIKSINISSSNEVLCCLLNPSCASCLRWLEVLDTNKSQEYSERYQRSASQRIEWTQWPMVNTLSFRIRGKAVHPLGWGPPALDVLIVMWSSPKHLWNHYRCIKEKPSVFFIFVQSRIPSSTGICASFEIEIVFKSLYKTIVTKDCHDSLILWESEKSIQQCYGSSRRWR